MDLASLVFKNNQLCKSCGGARVRPVKPLCQHCRGEGVQTENIQREVTVTPLSSRMVTIPGSGNHILGGKPGNLIVDIQVDPDPVYHVQKLDLYRDLKVTPVQAVLGDVVTVDVFGKQVDIKIPSGCQTGSSLTLRQEGVSYGGQKGDLFVKVHIKVPRSITPGEKDLYMQILELERSERRTVDG
jgi:DnaJ-class molecular chaperone